MRRTRTPPTVNGSCGSAFDSCTAGTPSGINDVSWNCLGNGGGSTAACVLPVYWWPTGVACTPACGASALAGTGWECARYVDGAVVDNGDCQSADGYANLTAWEASPYGDNNTRADLSCADYSACQNGGSADGSNGMPGGQPAVAVAANNSPAANAAAANVGAAYNAVATLDALAAGDLEGALESAEDAGVDAEAAENAAAR